MNYEVFPLWLVGTRAIPGWVWFLGSVCSHPSKAVLFWALGSFLYIQGLINTHPPPTYSAQVPETPWGSAFPPAKWGMGERGLGGGVLKVPGSLDWDGRGLGQSWSSGIMAVIITNDERPKEGKREGKRPREALKLLYPLGCLGLILDSWTWQVGGESSDPRGQTLRQVKFPLTHVQEAGLSVPSPGRQAWLDSGIREQGAGLDSRALEEEGVGGLNSWIPSEDGPRDWFLSSLGRRRPGALIPGSLPQNTYSP